MMRCRIIFYLIFLLHQSDNDSIDTERELWTWSRSVMMGYAGREDATLKDMTEDGWLKTGDLVREEQGFHFIVGREKDLIITAGGENVAPQPINERVLDNLPIISQVASLRSQETYQTELLFFRFYSLETNKNIYLLS